MIIFNKDTERNNGRKDRAQDVRIDSLQSAVDELNADIAEIEITVENLSQSIDDKYAAQTQTLMSELNSRIQSLISNLEDFVNTAQVNADVGNFKNLYATVLSNLKNLTVDLVSVTGSASIAAATITSEEVTSSQIQTLQATTATISELTVTLLHLANISATNVTAEKVTADEVETDLLKADEARADVVKAKNITGKGWQTPIGTPDNTELLKITIPHYEGVIQLVTEDNEFSVTVFDNALIAWSEGAEYLFRVQRTSNSTELYLQNIGDTVNYQLVFIGSADTVTSTSEIVDKTGIRQNVLTLNGVYGVAEGGSGGGSSIVFVDIFPVEGEDGVIYVSKELGAKVWDNNKSELVPLTGTILQGAVQSNTANIGTLSDLTTTAVSDLVSAINEVDANTDTNTGAIATINGNDTGLSMREVAQNVAGNVYIPCGSVAFANLPALSGARIGDVYNVTDSFTTTSDFIEGAGHVIPSGTNVVVIDNNGVKKWDVFSMPIDISGFMTKVNPEGTGIFSMNRRPNSTAGNYSTTVGNNNIASGDGAFAEGGDCQSNGEYSHTEGYSSVANGQSAHAEGRLGTANGNYSHAEGQVSTASGNNSHAEGNHTTASGLSSHAEGNYTEASGDYSHAEGHYSTAEDSCAHAEGDHTEAKKNSSHAEGAGTVAATDFQHVQGKYNVIDSQHKYIDIVGYGGGDTQRRNIEATTLGGDKRLKGTVYVGCNDDSTGGTDLGTTANQALSLAQSFSHNIPRYVNGVLGKDITAYITDGTLWKRLNGIDGFMLFEDVYAGDYFQMSRAITCPDSYQGAVGSDWVTIAGINTLWGNGDSGINYNHFVMIPGKGEKGLQHFGKHAMNDTNTTTGGYYNSVMCQSVLGSVVSAGSTASGATINQQLYAEFGAHLKTTREFLSTAINTSGYNRLGAADGCSSNWAWQNQQAVLMSEVEAYGSVVWSSSGYDTGTAKVQLPLFRFSTAALNNRSAYYWLKDVASASLFCYVNGDGSARYSYAGGASNFVRPRFVLA